MNESRRRSLSNSLLAACGLLLAGAMGSCSSTPDHAGDTSQALNAAPTPQIQHGRDLWLTATFGGEKFFTLLLPRPPFDLVLGFDDVLTTPRAQRFDRWGVVNDPDCTAGDASTFFLDRCPDPGATGVVGIRKRPNPSFDPSQPPSASNPPFLIGVACAGCHAGFEPTNPPANPNAPAWANVNVTVGNQFLRTGDIFDAHLAESDPRWQVFHTWAPGTVDTTAIESDHVNNPGMITPIYRFDLRPFFTNTYFGTPETVHRNGQGGEDDAGCERAVLRVYFNIGMCAAECMIPHLANGPGGSQTPIDLAECERVCPDLLAAEAAAPDVCAFIFDPVSNPAPKLASAPGGSSFIDARVVDEGRRVFARTCKGCHSNGEREDDYTDDLVHRATGFDPFLGEPPGDIGTNACRSRTTNWLTGHIWQNFSSDQLKARGPGFYRDMPLLAIWAQAPFMHNNRIGVYLGDPSVASRVAAFERSYDLLVNPWKRDFLGSISVTTVPITLPPPLPITLPAGTPVALFANVDPNNPLKNLCDDLVENGGHYFGALLSPHQKYALREFLKTL